MIDLALIAQAGLWLVVLAVFLASGRASVFHGFVFYLAFHGVVFVIRPLQVYYFQFDRMWEYMQFRPTEVQFVQTLAVSSLAMLVFGVCCVGFGGHPPSSPARVREDFSKTEKNSFVLTCLILTPVLIASIWATVGGAATGERRGSVYVMTGSSGYVNEAQFMIGSLICAWLLITRFHWSGLLGLALYLGYRSWCGWSRFTIILSVLGVFLILAWRRYRRWPPAWTIAVLIPVLLLFHALGDQRYIIRDVLTGQPVALFRAQAETLTPQDKRRVELDGPDFANFDFLAFILATVPERSDTYTYGTQYLQLFTEPIPRALWPGKPAGAPFARFDLNQYGNFWGMTVTMPGDAWMTGGWVGLILIMALGGVLLGRAHQWFWRNYQSPIVALFYATGLVVTPQLFRDGGVVSTAKFLLYSWFPLLLWRGIHWFCKGMPVRAVAMDFGPGTALQLIAAPGSLPDLCLPRRSGVVIPQSPEARRRLKPQVNSNSAGAGTGPESES